MKTMILVGVVALFVFAGASSSAGLSFGGDGAPTSGHDGGHVTLSGHDGGHVLSGHDGGHVTLSGHDGGH